MILDDIVAKKRIRVKERKERIAEEILKEKALKIVKKENEEGYVNLFKNALSKKGLSVIGEYKKASPSKGVIVEKFDIEKILNYYSSMSVDAFSILTEEDFFKGSDEYLKRIRELSKTPILRKDFIIDFYQIYEAKIIGANAVLLIVSVLKDNLKLFYDEAKKFNIQPLVEVHNKEELEIALKADAEIIGINNRDLKTFKVDLNTTRNLIKLIPDEKIKVTESGIMSIDDLKKVKEYGADGVLIGEFFMRNIENQEFKENYKTFKNGDN